MKLASLKTGDRKKRNGELALVSSDNRNAVLVPAAICADIIDALNDWDAVKPKLEALSRELNDGHSPQAFTFDFSRCQAPLTHAPGFYDGSAFLSHVYRARKSRGDEMPASAKVTPLMYQGVSDNLLGFNTPLDLMDPAFGGDFEGEFAVITTAVPKGTAAESLTKHVALLTMFNDITYREIVKAEIETKFGFLQSKPNSSFAPLMVTPDELGPLWDGNRLHADLTVKLNGKSFGSPNGKEMHFTFPQLVAHACRTRPLAAGSIVGCGTISNEDKSKGFACLTEKRFQEVLDQGKPVTPWLKPGDRVFMEVLANGVSVFGPIDQTAAVL